MASSYRFPLALHDVHRYVKDLVHHLRSLVPVTQEGYTEGPDIVLAQLHHQQVTLLYGGAEVVSGRDLCWARSLIICPLTCPRDSHPPMGEAPESLRPPQKPREPAPGLWPCTRDWQRQCKGSAWTRNQYTPPQHPRAKFREACGAVGSKAAYLQDGLPYRCHRAWSR